MEPAGTFPVLDRTYPYLMKIEEPQPEQPNQATHGYKPKSLLAQAGWLMIARVTGFAFTFLIPIVLSRVLDLKQFGLYKQAFLVVATSQSILPLGFGMSTFYFLSREHDRDKRVSIAGNALLFHVFVATLAAATVFFWPGILVLIFGSADLVRYSSQIAAYIASVDLFVPDRIHRYRKPGRDVFHRIHHHVAAHQKHRNADGGAVDTLRGRRVICGHAARGCANYSAAVVPAAALCRILAAFQLPDAAVPALLHPSTRARRADLHIAKRCAQLLCVERLRSCSLRYLLRGSSPAAFDRRDARIDQRCPPRPGQLSSQQEGRRKEILRLSIQVMRKLALVYWPLYALLMVVAN